MCMFDCECAHFSAFVYTLFGAWICFYSLVSLYCFYRASRSHLVITGYFGYLNVLSLGTYLFFNFGIWIFCFTFLK